MYYLFGASVRLGMHILGGGGGVQFVLHMATSDARLAITTSQPSYRCCRSTRVW